MRPLVMQLGSTVLHPLARAKATHTATRVTEEAFLTASPHEDAAAPHGLSLPIQRSFRSDFGARWLDDSVLHQGYAREPALPDYILAAVESKLELERTVALSLPQPRPFSAACFHIFQDSHTCVIILDGLITLGKHPP